MQDRLKLLIYESIKIRTILNAVQGLTRSLLHKKFKSGIVYSSQETNCPADIKMWKSAKTKKRVRSRSSCKCCNLITVKGSLYVQNPKYGIYSIDGERNGQLVYRQRWPTNTYNNNLIYFSKRLIIHAQYGKDEYHYGIEAETPNKCPTNVKNWKSWTG